MELRAGGASLLGYPVGGGMVKIDDADVHTLTQATGGFVRTAVKGVTIGIGAGVGVGVVGTAALTLFLGVMALAAQNGAAPAGGNVHPMVRVPITSLCSLQSSDRSFHGVCVTEEIAFYRHGVVRIPTHLIRDIYYEQKGFAACDGVIKIWLVDGSEYNLGTPDMITRYVEIITSAGIQRVSFTGGFFSLASFAIRGMSIADVTVLRSRLSEVLKGQTEIRLGLADETVSRFFAVDGDDAQVTTVVPFIAPKRNLREKLGIRFYRSDWLMLFLKIASVFAFMIGGLVALMSAPLIIATISGIFLSIA